MTSRNADETAVVLTGATSGIGQATARLLASRTSRLFVHGPQRLSEIAGLLAELRAASRGEVHYVQADFDGLAAVEKLAAEISNRTDRVDVLVNNAGRPGSPRRSVGGDAEAGYREAIDRFAGTRLRPELARSHLLYGEWLRRERRLSEARERLRTAHELFTTMGLGAFADRAARELEAAGISVRKREAVTSGGLTPLEEQVARLASEGLTNAEIGSRLFVSSRTVEYHLHKVFAKTGIRSRNALAMVLRRRSGSRTGVA
ncbi:SDR family NAD(P)-dependent oxidoreductase [Nonomuraea polychroma]|uniref:SDR family NAD(P)-dependent oxidoreductase n=1 Tax=Nonomuraea polychroma TaxID=46176 RepID=UPI001F4E4778|nr:SDR family NAD(P)-dependent oxidoreductase [Nonomuraea polychroma]